jgi:ankyrin repeat protein
MKNVNTQNISSLSDYDRTMSCFGNGRLNKKNIVNKNNSIEEEDAFIDNFEEVTNQIKLYEYISSGLDENIDTIIKIIKSDPKRNIYDISQKEHYFINKKNYEGYTALYIACLNGHTKIVDILLNFHADHLIKCGVEFY